MQKGEALQAMETDMKEAVSTLKKEEYERALRRASDAIDLRVIEQQVRTDSRLSQGHRIRLLNSIENSLNGPPPNVQSGDSRTEIKAKEAKYNWRPFR